MTKRLIGTIALAATLGTGGVVLTATPAAAEQPDGCPMLEHPGPVFDHIAIQGLQRLWLVCKSRDL